MQRRPESRAFAGRPNPAAEGRDRVRAPVQADAVVRVFRLGGVSLVEDALEVATGDADTVVLATQMQLLALVFAHDLGSQAQHPALVAGVAHGVGGVDDEILQHQPQYGAGYTHRPDLPQRLIGVDAQTLPARIRDDLQGLTHEIGETHGLDHLLVARRLHQLRECALHQRRLPLDHLEVVARLLDTGGHLAAAQVHECPEIPRTLRGAVRTFEFRGSLD